MLFPFAAVIFLVLMVAAFAAAAAIAWHLLNYRIPGDLGAWLATLFLIATVMLIAGTVASFLAVPWDSLPALFAPTS